MTGSRATTSHGSATSGNTASPKLDNGILSVEASAGPAADVGRRLVELTGTCPQELVARFVPAHRLPDSRGLRSLVIRYESLHENDLVSQRSDQDVIRVAVWKSFSKPLPEVFQPQITFDMGRPSGNGTLGRIDLSFSIIGAFYIVLDSLKEIKTGSSTDEGGQAQIYKRTSFADVVPGDIFRIDCLILPLNERVDLQAFRRAAEQVTAGIGQLLGIAKVVITSDKWRPESSAGIHRLYVRLKRSVMAIPLADLASRLPSHLLWHGVPYKLLFVGEHLRPPCWSEDFPEEHHDEPTPTLPAGPLLSPSDDDASAATTPKKRRPNEA